MRISDWSSDVCSFRSRLWVQTDSGATDAAEFGHNAMYHIDQKTGESKRFLVGPVGCEITGIAYNEDLTTFFINIQHPNGAWNTLRAGGGDARSATVVVRREDGQPVGAGSGTRPARAGDRKRVGGGKGGADS